MKATQYVDTAKMKVTFFNAKPFLSIFIPVALKYTDGSHLLPLNIYASEKFLFYSHIFIFHYVHTMLTLSTFTFYISKTWNSH